MTTKPRSHPARWLDTYTDLDGTLHQLSEPLNWLEDGIDFDGRWCARYAIADETSVWLNEEMQEVHT